MLKKKPSTLLCIIVSNTVEVHLYITCFPLNIFIGIYFGIKYKESYSIKCFLCPHPFFTNLKEKKPLLSYRYFDRTQN